MHILLSEEEERMLYRLREDLFHVDWTSPAFKTMVRDEVKGMGRSKSCCVSLGTRAYGSTGHPYRFSCRVYR